MLIGFALRNKQREITRKQAGARKSQNEYLALSHDHIS